MPSISVAKGKGSIAHNNRDFITENVNEDRTPDNITYKSEPLEQAYQKCFGQAIEDYNDKQKRSDRKIDGVKGYMQQIKNSGNGEKLFYENVVQIGNMFDSHVSSEQGKVCKEILDDYMKGFEERNPNLYVFNAVLHLDEQTPHLHIDYIPIATDYTRGLQVRNSLAKALKQQGIESQVNSRFDNTTLKWQNREKDHIETLMKERGLERTAETGEQREHLSVEQYKAAAQQVKLAVEQLPEQIPSTPAMFSKEKVTVLQSDLEKLEQRAKLSIVHEAATEKIKENIDAVYEKHSKFIDEQNAIISEVTTEQIEIRDELKKEKQSAYNLKQQYARETAGLRADRAELQKETLKYTDLYTQQKDLNNINQQLQKENAALKAKIDDFERSIEGRVNIAVKKAKEPLEAEISSLKGKIEEQATQITSLNSIMEDLRNRLRGAYESVKSIVQAVGMLKYDKTDGYKVDELSKKQDRLIDGVAEYGALWAREDGFEDLAEAMEKRIGISKGIQKIIEPQQQKKKDELVL